MFIILHLHPEEVDEGMSDAVMINVDQIQAVGESNIPNTKTITTAVIVMDKGIYVRETWGEVARMINPLASVVGTK